ncbi:AAA family ATPase [Nesterenkonia xinjiangensis]|uniref:AAA+ ATPase domain-containing protein n=1 Tax=Nesterenkonia xinjiangensis TaxID=225327 RepID=A0A7Z0GNP5_9MICC|nr:AAA family ATPase [Nesterenkonia xinjiangensis]NYJ78253.1 hypothetical protein [Nesterenkonia xinjiangensis]
MSEDNTSVPRSPDTGGGNGNRSLYGDVGAFLAAGMPDPPAPEILPRTDGTGLFYRGQVNVVFGEPESGKTTIALHAALRTIRGGGRAAVIDLDHNSMAGIVSKLLAIGAEPDELTSLDRFRYAEPDDRAELQSVVMDLSQWGADVVVLDSIGELLPAMALNSNSPDDFTLANAAVLKPLAMSGACVIAVDHVSKHGGDKGPTGTAAKRRAAGGVMLQVTVKEPFTPGSGGSAYVSIYKDRHGGLRANSPTGEREPLAGTFVMHQDGTCIVYAAEAGERKPAAVPAEDLDALARLDPPPSSVRDVKERMHWRTDRAADVLRVYRSQIDTGADARSRSPSVPGEQEHGTVPVPHPYVRGTGNTSQGVA